MRLDHLLSKEILSSDGGHSFHPVETKSQLVHWWVLSDVHDVVGLALLRELMIELYLLFCFEGFVPRRTA